MALEKLKYARPYLHVLAMERELACQNGSAAKNLTNNACTLGTIDDPGTPACNNGGLPLSDCTTGTTAGTSTTLSTCVVGTVAAAACAGGGTPNTGVTYSACSGGTGVTN